MPGPGVARYAPHMNRSDRSPASPFHLLAGPTIGVSDTNGFARFAYGSILPAMREDLGWNYAEAGWLKTANALDYVLGALGANPGPRRRRPLRRHVLCDRRRPCRRPLSRRPAPHRAGHSHIFRNRRRGFGIVLAGALLPPLLAIWGLWAWGWIGIGPIGLLFAIPSLWAARTLGTAAGGCPPKDAPVPTKRTIGETIGHSAFGMGSIVYLTLIAAWITAQDAPAPTIAGIWMPMGLGIMAPPFVWRGIFARSGVPLAMILTTIAIGSALRTVWPTLLSFIVSASISGLSVFMALGAIANFSRQNLASESWEPAIGQFTVVFAISQTPGPIGAGPIGDTTRDIGYASIAAASVLLIGAVAALCQRPLDPARTT